MVWFLGGRMSQTVLGVWGRESDGDDGVGVGGVEE